MTVGVLTQTERDECPRALIPWRAAHCLSGPVADAVQISWLEDKKTYLPQDHPEWQYR